MKTKKILYIIILLIVSTGTYGFAFEKSLVNTQTFDGAGIHSVSISYVAADITILESEKDEIVLKEYMNRNDSQYFARITNTKGILNIEAGKRPLLSMLSVSVEIYLPKTYYDKLSVSSVSGKINAKKDLIASNLNISSTSGGIILQAANAKSINIKNTSGRIEAENITGSSSIQSSSGHISIKSVEGLQEDITNTSGVIQIEKITAETIKLKNTSGKIIVNNASGTLTAKSTSGLIKISNAEGSANLTSVSGSVRAVYYNVTGDIVSKTTSGKVSLTIPDDTSFHFDASTASGNIQTAFHDKGANKSNKAVSHQVGSSPDISIEVNTVSGGIELVTLKSVQGRVPEEVYRL